MIKVIKTRTGRIKKVKTIIERVIHPDPKTKNKLNINFDQLAEDKGLHRLRFNRGCIRSHEHNLSDEYNIGFQKYY